MLARIFVAIGVLVVLALTAALVGPHFVDWSSYRADFEREAAAVLGRKVTVKGDATATLLPFPSVTFTEVVVGDAAAPAMTVETFSMDAELAPFLRGEFLIFDMRLVRPRMAVDVAADGKVDWAVRPSTPFDPNSVSLEKLTITGGELLVRHRASGREHRLSEIDAELSARSLAGPWRGEGTLQLNGARTALSVSTGAVDDTGGLRLRVRVEPAEGLATLETDGTLRLEGGAPVYAGEFRTGQRVPAGEGGEVPEPPGTADPEPFRVSGSFRADNRRFALEPFRFETGPREDPYVAEGTAELDYGGEPHFSISAKGAQVQFDQAVAGADETASLTLAERLSALERTLVALPKPAIPGTVELDLPAVVAGDTTVREVRLSAEPAPEGWRIGALSAQLPGRTTLEAAGLLVTGERFGFTGSLLVAVAQPSGFAAWLAKDVDEAVRRLPAAGFSAQVELARGRQAFRDLELALGGASFRGQIERNEDQAVRPSIAMQLEGSSLDIDGLAALAALFVSDGGANRFQGHDLDIRLKAGPVSAAGFVADSLDTALRLRGDTLEIDRLSIAGLAGAAISATGSLAGLPGQPNGTLDATVVAEDLAPLIARAVELYPQQRVFTELADRAAIYPGLFADAQLDLVVTAGREGDEGSLTLESQGRLGGSGFTATLSGRGDAAAPGAADLSLSVEARNDDATALLALYGLPVAPLGLTGAGETTLTMSGRPDEGMRTELNLVSGSSSAGFQGSVVLGERGLTAKGQARLEAADIEPWLMTAGVALPGMGLGTRVDLKAEADAGEGLLVLSELQGTVAEGAVSGDVNLSAVDGVPHVAGALALDSISLDPAFAAVLGDTSIESDPGEWPSRPFPQAMVMPFTAEVDLAVGAVSAAGSPNVYDANFDLTIGGDGLRISRLSGKLFGGEVSGLLELKNNGGTGLFSTQGKLTGADLALAFPQSGVSGRADFSAALTANGKSVGGLVSSLSGSGTALIENLSLPGINPEAFPALLARADAVGRDIDEAKTAGFAPALVADGRFETRRLDLAFTVAGGVLRAPPATLEGGDAVLSANLRADLNTGRVAADGTLTYKAGDEALAGSEPALRFVLEGPLGATSLTFDTEPLAQFLVQRALEREQARVEAMQAALLEKQRLRRETMYYASLQEERQRLAEERRRADEAERVRLEAEQARALEAVRRKKEAEEAARKAAESAARQLQEDARRAEEAEREREEAERVAAEAKARVDRLMEPRTEGDERAPLPPIGERSTEELGAEPLPPISVDEFLNAPGG